MLTLKIIGEKKVFNASLWVVSFIGFTSLWQKHAETLWFTVATMCKHTFAHCLKYWNIEMLIVLVLQDWLCKCTKHIFPLEDWPCSIWQVKERDTTAIQLNTGLWISVYLSDIPGFGNSKLWWSLPSRRSPASLLQVPPQYQWSVAQPFCFSFHFSIGSITTETRALLKWSQLDI